MKQKSANLLPANPIVISNYQISIKSILLVLCIIGIITYITLKSLKDNGVIDIGNKNNDTNNKPEESKNKMKAGTVVAIVIGVFVLLFTVWVLVYHGGTIFSKVMNLFKDNEKDDDEKNRKKRKRTNSDDNLRSNIEGE